MGPKKGQGRSKGKQPAPKAAPQREAAALSSDDEEAQAWQAILDRIAALEQRLGRPSTPAEVACGGGRTKPAADVKAEVLARLSALQGKGKESVRAGRAALALAHGSVQGQQGPDATKIQGASEEEVPVAEGGRRDQLPWGGPVWSGGPCGQSPASGTPANSQIAVPVPNGGWAGHLAPPLPQVVPGGGWGYPSLWGMTNNTVPVQAMFGDPLGFHLSPATRDRICRGEYVDMFSLLIRKPETSEEEEEDDRGGRNRRKLKRRKVDRMWANWLSAFLIYASVVVQSQPWRAPSLFKYLDIIFQGYSNFSGLAWLYYDEGFRIRAASNPSLRWDVIHPQLWLEIMVPARKG